jgi:hypothetical protein
MKYELPKNDGLSKDIFSIGRFDYEWTGGKGAFHNLLRYLELQVNDRALKVCTETFKGDSENKAFDRGYVKGIYEVLKLLEYSYEEGKILQYPEQTKHKGPRTV